LKIGIKRLPVMSGKTLAGIVTRSNLLQAVASFAREIPDPSADDDRIRDRIIGTVTATDWSPIVFDATVRDGVVHLHGVITTDGARRAAIVAAENVAGVKEVHDNLCFVDIYSGQYVEAHTRQ
jgi:CBS-domain-containing membrane protein